MPDPPSILWRQAGGWTIYCKPIGQAYAAKDSIMRRKFFGLFVVALVKAIDVATRVSDDTAVEDELEPDMAS
jgi:hypothetical protein